MKKIACVCITLLTFILLAEPVFAANSNIHTWQYITAKNGFWQGRLVMASANEKGFFTDANGHGKGQIYDFQLNPDKKFKFGFGFDVTQTDFNVSFTLTLYKTSNAFGSPLFTSPACVFNITAKSPANPDIRVEKFHGAICSYVVTGYGENFYVA